MSKRNWTIVLSLSVVFASGVAVGFFSHWLYTSRTVSAKAPPRTPEDFRRHYVETMRDRLHLEPAQVDHLNVILDDTRNRYKELKEKYRPEMKVIQQGQVASISAILTEAQRMEYEKMRKEREDKNKQQEHKGPPPGF